MRNIATGFALGLAVLMGLVGAKIATAANCDPGYYDLCYCEDANDNVSIFFFASVEGGSPTSTTATPVKYGGTGTEHAAGDSKGTGANSRGAWSHKRPDGGAYQNSDSLKLYVKGSDCDRVLVVTSTVGGLEECVLCP
jgi:hypothetical protein